MLILGRNKDDLIVQVSERELDRAIGRYYNQQIPGLKKSVSQLVGGDVVPLEQIIDQYQKLREVCEMYLKSSETFLKSNETMLKFAEMILAEKESTK